MLLGLLGQDLRNLPDEFGQIPVHEVPLHLVRLDARDVEDVRDQVHQTAQVLVHDLQVVLPVGGGLGAAQVVEPAADGGQGRAQLVGHGGQEVRLEAVQGLQFIVGPGQFARGAAHLFLQSAPALFQLAAHVLQGPAQAVHLVAAADMHLAGELAPADPVGHGFQLSQGPQDQMADQEIESHDGQHDQGQGGEEELGPAAAEGIEHVLGREVDAQAPADGSARVVLVAGQAGLVDEERGGVLEHGLAVVPVEDVILPASGLGEALDGRHFELVGAVFRVHGRQPRKPEAVEVLVQRVEGEALGDHGRGEALQGAALRLQQVGVEARAAPGAGGVLADEDALAVGHPLSGQDDLLGQDAGLIDHLGPGLPLLGHGLPEEDDPKQRNDDADDG
ncbi:hypothetical protein DSECCO2_496760 [anaerobic digester metagenome]